MATDYFGVLGVARDASDSDIKRAYRRLARDLHPDVNPDPGAKERFQEVTRAYEALTDPDKRRIVDLGGDPFDPGGGGGASGFGGAVLVRIGEENAHEALSGASVVSVGYGSGDRALGGPGIGGPTRQGSPTNIGPVRAGAPHVGPIGAAS